MRSDHKCWLWLALTGAILVHSNPRSTAIYAHVQNDPSRRAANRVTKKVAAALAGKAPAICQRPPKSKAQPTDLGQLVANLVDRLTAEGIDKVRVRSIITEAMTGKGESVAPTGRAT